MNRYKHGGDAISFARRHGCDVDDVLDLSANTRPFGLPPRLRKRFISEWGELTNYPDVHAERFCNTVALRYGVSKECVVPANGSIQLIYALCSSPQYEGTITVEPTFNEYRRAADAYRKTHASVWGLGPSGYEVDVNALNQLTLSDRIVFLCRPNNPTGTLVSEETVTNVLDAISDKNGLLVVDEAFIEFASDRSIAHWIVDRPNLVVLRSLTKYFGLAGLRIGYALAHPETAERISQLIPPWSLNTIAQSAGEWVLNHTNEFDRCKKIWLQEAQRMILALQKNLYFEVYPSSTSFFLFRIANPDKAKTFYASLAKKAVSIRCCDDFWGLNEAYFRVGVRTPEENQRFLDAVECCLSC